MAAFAPAFLFGQTTIIDDNFDTYTAGGTLVSESGGPWDTWSGGGGTAEDPVIDTMSNSAPNSANVFNGGAQAYLHDVVLPFPSTYTTGVYEFSMNVYVPSGSGGYFNLGSVWASGGAGYEYGTNVFFNADASGMVDASGTGVFTYTQDAWTAVSVMVDLVAGMVTVSIDGSQVHSGGWLAPGGFGVADIFGIAYTDGTGATETTSNFYIDDVMLIDHTGVGVEENASDLFSVNPNPSNGNFLLNVADAGTYSVTVMDISGKSVHAEQLVMNTNSTQPLNLDLPAGIYMLNLNNGVASTTERIIIK